MQVRALIAGVGLLALGGCAERYNGGSSGGYYAPSGYASGTYYGGSPSYSYGDRDYRREPDRREPERREPDRRDSKRPDNERDRTDYRPPPPERAPAYRPPPPSSDRPAGYSGGQTERDAERFNRNRRGPEPGE